MQGGRVFNKAFVSGRLRLARFGLRVNPAWHTFIRRERLQKQFTKVAFSTTGEPRRPYEYRLST